MEQNGAPESPSSSSGPDLEELWGSLLRQQTTLFKKTVTENATLLSKVEELQREVNVWKDAHKHSEAKKNELNKEIRSLDKKVISMKNNNSLIVCLIDGDGNIFHPRLLQAGQNGGREAAHTISEKCQKYVEEKGIEAAQRPPLWMTIFCNKSGLIDILVNNKICSADNFEAFCQGFNQAGSLFSIVDVGNGKEAADTKIKEYMKLFIRFPQTLTVFFGGGHDNGYASTLTNFVNENLFNKIVLLKGYRDVASELRTLNMPYLECPTVFREGKLQRLQQHQRSPSNRAPSFQEKSDSFGLVAADTPQVLSISRQHSKPMRLPTPGVPMNKQRPPPCNYFYLSSCKSGDQCRYGHDYLLSPENIHEIHQNALQTPCLSVNQDLECPNGTDCINGHVCPSGPKCKYFKQGKCKFTGSDMHRAPKPVSARDFYPQQFRSSTASSHRSIQSLHSSNSLPLSSASRMSRSPITLARSPAEAAQNEVPLVDMNSPQPLVPPGLTRVLQWRSNGDNGSESQ